MAKILHGHRQDVDAMYDKITTTASKIVDSSIVYSGPEVYIGDPISPVQVSLPAQPIEIIREVIKEVPVEVIKYVDREVEVIREVVREVQVPVEHIVEHIIRETIEVEKIVEKPIVTIKEVIKEVEKEIPVYIREVKTHKMVWAILAVSLICNVVQLILH